MEGINAVVNEAEGFLKSSVYTIVLWALFSFALCLIARKLKSKRPWLAWIPGLRYISLGSSLGMTREGIFIAIAETLSFLNSFIMGAIKSETASVAASLILLVLIVFMLVYRIRLFLRLTRAFGRKRAWIILWIFAEVLTALIFGVF